MLSKGRHWLFDALWKVRVDVASQRDPWLAHDKLDWIVKSSGLTDRAEVVASRRCRQGARNLDSFLTDKDAVACEFEQQVRRRAHELGLELVSVGVRDVILPGDMKDLMNTELVWLDDRPPAEVAEFFGREYPAMTRVQAINEALSVSGYENMGDFTLPDSAWWDDYYTPLNAKLPALKQKYAGDEQALAVIASSEAEIDLRRRFGESYGYQFFVARKVDRQNG